MNIVPVLLRPGVLSMRNRFRGRLELRGSSGRDLIFSLFLAGLMLVTYRGTVWILRKINEDPNLIFLPPAQPLGLFLFFLLIMVFLSGLVAAYDGLFQSHDLDLIRSTPIRRERLFVGKFLWVFVYSSWMPALLLIPVLVAFGQAYGGDPWYYTAVPVVFLPYFLLPAALSMLAAILFGRFVPGNRLREIFAVVIIAVGCGAFMLMGVIREAWSSAQRADGLLQLVSLFSRPQTPWLPSNWIAISVDQLLRGGAEWNHLVLSFLVTGGVLALAYMLFDLFYDDACSISRSSKNGSRLPVAAGVDRLVGRIPGLDSVIRALVSKEIRLFAREMTQTVQLLMLCGLAAVYLYNIRLFLVVKPLTLDAELWYPRFIFIGNFTIGAFVSIAACTRLVYPSLSLEGKSYWVLRSAPVSLEQLMRVKFWCWFIPVGVLSLVLFVAGALSVGIGSFAVVAYGFCSVCIAYGVVGSACGLGAVYSNFDWEHPSQLAAGFGSLMYMLYSTLLIMLTMVPTWMIIFAGPNSLFVEGRPPFLTLCWVALNCSLILLINFAGARFAIHWGVKELQARERTAR